MTLLYVFGILLLVAGIWLAYSKHGQQAHYEQLLRDMKQQYTQALGMRFDALNSMASNSMASSEPMALSTQTADAPADHHVDFMNEFMTQIDFQLSQKLDQHAQVMIWVPAYLTTQLIHELKSTEFSACLYEKIDQAIAVWIVLDSLNKEIQYVSRQLRSTEQPHDIILEWNGTSG